MERLRSFSGYSSFDLLDDLSHSCVDLLVAHDIFGRVHEQDVDRCGQFMLLPAPCLADTSLAQISLYSSFEAFFRYGYKNPGMVASGVLADKVAHARYISVTTLGKQFLDKVLAAEPFFFLECI